VLPRIKFLDIVHHPVSLNTANTGTKITKAPDGAGAPVRLECFLISRIPKNGQSPKTQ
jgi:hypothetical protein